MPESIEAFWGKREGRNFPLLDDCVSLRRGQIVFVGEGGGEEKKEKKEKSKEEGLGHKGG